MRNEEVGLEGQMGFKSFAFVISCWGQIKDGGIFALFWVDGFREDTNLF